ncbi:KH domain-containing, RNA-binding, signal transduction-associated protein 2-like isoform X2 [Schistocerca gregaria]|uniref:KH domain-containing, RNA-binding, signal transduction-associated protein 2-like isoform X2 n=1 Tax=Schistocerca cancellata TaxID=274614 RepID=UPI002117D4CC|nr:KH domain-containing, RNA-binding, signal transduction-associated protein 2-like isoform X2 [Schistocerca cancellata]XP_049833421.1 KH domain-containing, RNA-binding, signal transduction-associated protein 2-like isoform X2 [Schistocerca gregaria]
MADNSAANGDLNRNNNISGTDCMSDTNSANVKSEGDMETQIPPEKAGEYVRELLQEKQSLDSSQWPNALRLLDQEVTKEVARVQAQGRPLPRESKYVDIYREKPIRVAVKVLVPIKEHPKFNFVGKLLGPKGNSMKRLQEDTMTKMAVLGRGSMKDKQKEEELRASKDPKYAHLSDDLHVEIAAFAPPAEAHARIAYALAELRKYLIPDSNDEIRQEQMREMELIQTVSGEPGVRVQDAAAAAAAAAAGRKVPRGRALPLRSAVAGSGVPAGPPPPPRGRGLLGPPPPPPPGAVRGPPGGLRKPAPPLPPPPPPQALLPRPTPTKTKVLSILDRARAAMEETGYGGAGDEERAAAGTFYDTAAYDSYAATGYSGYEDYEEGGGDYYDAAAAYPDDSASRWKAFKSSTVAGVSTDRPRYRPTPYARPAK